MSKQFTRIILHLEDPEMTFLERIADQEGRSVQDHMLYILRRDLLQRSGYRQPTDNQPAKPEKENAPA